MHKINAIRRSLLPILIYLFQFLSFTCRYATILAFDVKVERDAQELADSLGVKIFQADIIYHLFDKFTAYREEIKQKKRDEFKSIAVFPCKMKVCVCVHICTWNAGKLHRCEQSVSLSTITTFRRKKLIWKDMFLCSYLIETQDISSCAYSIRLELLVKKILNKIHHLFLNNIYLFCRFCHSSYSTHVIRL